MGAALSCCCGDSGDSNLSSSASASQADAYAHKRRGSGGNLGEMDSHASARGTKIEGDWFYTPPSTPTRVSFENLKELVDEDGDDSLEAANKRRRVPYPTKLKEGYVNLTQDQRRAVRQLRLRVQDDYPEVWDEDMRPIFDLVMTRMLRSRKFDVIKAEPLFRVHLAWRREYNPRKVMHEQEALRGEPTKIAVTTTAPAPASSENGQSSRSDDSTARTTSSTSTSSSASKLQYVSVSGRDADGHPVLIMRVALKFNQWKGEVKRQPKLTDADAKKQSAGLLAHHSSIEERMLIELADTNVESMVSVVDLTGVNTMDFFRLGGRIAKVMRPYTVAIQEQYRGTMHKTYVYPAGALFRFMVTLATPFVRAHVLAKVQGITKSELMTKLNVLVPDFEPLYDD